MRERHPLVNLEFGSAEKAGQVFRTPFTIIRPEDAQRELVVPLSSNRDGSSQRGKQILNVEHLQLTVADNEMVFVFPKNLLGRLEHAGVPAPSGKMHHITDANSRRERFFQILSTSTNETSMNNELTAALFAWVISSLQVERPLSALTEQQWLEFHDACADTISDTLAAGVVDPREHGPWRFAIKALFDQEVRESPNRTTYLKHASEALIKKQSLKQQRVVNRS